MITIDYDLYTNECRNKYERKMYEIFARNTNEIRKKYEGHTNEIQLKYERNANVYKKNNYFLRAGPRVTGKF